MFFLSIPYAWHLVGTWSEQLPDNANLIGMSEVQFMMTLHSIFIPVLLGIATYLTIKLTNQSKGRVLDR